MTLLLSLVNGEPLESVSIQDRGLLYGQSLFETIAIENSTPLLLDRHLARLQQGADRLQIPYHQDLLAAEIQSVCDRIEQLKFVIRVTLTMGDGGRGYANPLSPNSVRLVSAHSFPDYSQISFSKGIRLGLSSISLADQPLLAGIKHGNRLEQVLARASWSNDWQEAILLDQQGRVIEATQSNVFARKGTIITTPSLDRCGVAGVMREQIIELSEKSSFQVNVGTLRVPDLQLADEIFVTNSLIGLWPVGEFQAAGFSDFKAAAEFTKLLRSHGAVPIN